MCGSGPEVGAFEEPPGAAATEPVPSEPEEADAVPSESDEADAGPSEAIAPVGVPTEEQSLLKCWLLCETFGYDNKKLIPALIQVESLRGKIARLKTVWSEGLVRTPTREEAIEIFREFGLQDAHGTSLVPELAAFTWPTICTLDNCTLRRCPFMVTHNEPTMVFDDLQGDALILSPDGQINSRARSFVLEYEVANDDVAAMHEELANQVKGRDIDIIVGTLPPSVLTGETTTALAYFRKNDTKKLSPPTLSGLLPRVYRVNPGGGPRSAAMCVQKICKTLSFIAGTIFMQTSDFEYSMEQLTEAVKSLSAESFNMLKGKFLLKAKKERTDFECAFLRVSTILASNVPKDVGKVTPLLIDLLDPPEWVRSLSALRGLEVVGQRLVEEPDIWQTYTLRDIFCNPGILQQYSIALCGDNATTGFGKSMVSIVLACVYAQALQKQRKSRGQPDLEKRYALLSNNLDAAKLVDFAVVLLWLLDEVEPHDAAQQQFMSESILKVLLTPKLQCSLRVKGSDVLVIPAGTGRIFTSNCPTGEDWVGSRFKWTSPMARKVIWFTITEPLLSLEARREEITEEANADADELASAAQDLMADAGL